MSNNFNNSLHVIESDIEQYKKNFMYDVFSVRIEDRSIKQIKIYL